MDMESKNSLMEIFTKVNINMENSKAKDNIFGKMVHIIKANLSKAKEMEKDSGNFLNLKKYKLIKDNILMTKKMVMEFIVGPMVLITKVISKMIKNMVLEKLDTKMVKF